MTLMPDAEAETESTSADLCAREEDFAVGRWISLEELTARLQSKAESRVGPSTTPEESTIKPVSPSAALACA